MSEATSKNKATRKKRDRHLNKQYNLRLPETLKEAFDDACRDQDVSFRDAVQYLILTAIRDKLPLKPEEDYYDY